jgi:hypothetical protein
MSGTIAEYYCKDKMLLIDKQKFVQGINFRQKIPYQTIKKLMASNSQYIVELSTDMKM